MGADHRAATHGHHNTRFLLAAISCHPPTIRPAMDDQKPTTESKFLDSSEGHADLDSFCRYCGITPVVVAITTECWYACFWKEPDRWKPLAT